MLEIFYLIPYQKLVVGVAIGLSFYAWLFWPWNIEKDITKRKRG